MPAKLEEYCEFVLSLADFCRREKIAGKWQKGLQSWYLYRHSFYGFCHYHEPRPVFASQRAQRIYGRCFKGDDLRELKWADQPKFDKGRKIFIREHVYNGDMFRKHVEAISGNKNRVGCLADIVRQNYCIAWILKKEDKKLGKGDRGNDLESALKYYDQKGIQLIGLD